MEKKKKEKIKKKLRSTQEVLYAREFKKADQAGGFSQKTIL
ncbi:MULTISPECIES: YfhE family protein [Bacillus]|nr:MULTISPECIES: YfhE family protein [Bacillus]